MALIFANGGTPAGNDPYLGVNYTDSVALLTQIESTLVAAGWVTQSGTPAVPPMILEGDSNGDKIYIHIDVKAGAGNQSFIVFRGSDDDLGTNLSEDDIIRFEMTTGQGNFVYIVADTYAFAIANFPFSGVSEIVAFGYPENRLDPLDTGAVYLCKPFTAVENGSILTIPNDYTNGYSCAYVKEAAHDQALWDRIGKRYTTPTTSSHVTGALALPMETILNTTSKGNHNSTPTFGQTNVANSMYWGHIGSDEGNQNAPVSNDYYFIEGRAISQYGSFLGVGVHPSKYIRGKIPFIKTGFSHKPSQSQWNSPGGEVYITAQAPYQAMRIA